MANTGLLILTNPARVGNLLPAIRQHVLKTLYIQYFPDKSLLLSSAGLQSPPAAKFRGPRYSQLVASIYALASIQSSCLDVRVLLLGLKNPAASIIHTKRPVELVIFDQNYSSNDAKTFMQDCLANTSMGCRYITFDDKDQCNDDAIVAAATDALEDKTNQEDKMYKSVVLGGTFDRLHIGHKIFLSNAILRCTGKMTVGVTDINMLYRKTLYELIEPCTKRISVLKDFAEDVDPSLVYNVVPINDMYGPTKDDPDMDMIVVSEETKRGAILINEKRTENGLNKLDTHVVKLVEDKNHEEFEESKISSSNQRIRMLGTRLKPPNIDGKPIRPYLIGLTGGIASGKSSIADKLQKLGAALINCDLVAHSLYTPGMKCYNTIVETFGSEYTSPDGQINRRALGNLVFNDKNELDKLNKILWPAILEEAKKQIDDFYKKGFDIIVVEAAVLIQAGWQPVFHEIWTCIVPQEEAVKRLMERNNLSEEDAKKRIQVQPSNTEQVKNAHVVVSTLWSHDVTEKQVQKAWTEILKDLEKYPKS